MNRPARTDSFDHTITGLLKKRANLLMEAVACRDKIAEIRNDVEALDRVLGTLGYSGDLDTQMPRQKRQVLFGKGELTRGILDELRAADATMTTRDIARGVLALNGQDARDRKLLTEHTRRVSKALRLLKEAGTVKQSQDVKGNVMWQLAPRSARRLNDPQVLVPRHFTFDPDLRHLVINLDGDMELRVQLHKPTMNALINLLCSQSTSVSDQAHSPFESTARVPIAVDHFHNAGTDTKGRTLLEIESGDLTLLFSLREDDLRDALDL